MFRLIITHKVVFLYLLSAMVLSCGGDKTADQTNTSSGSSTNTATSPGKVVEIDGGMDHTVALMSDGTVWVWGNGDRGQLGNGSEKSSNYPIQVPTLSDIKAVSAGGDFTVALKSDGTVWTWGDNKFGQLGIGKTGGYHSTPKQVKGWEEDLQIRDTGYLTGIIDISAGDSHTLALKNDFTVWAWGNNTENKLLGINSTSKIIDSPYKVEDIMNPPVSNIVSVAAGKTHSAAIDLDGTIFIWGINKKGEIGDGTMNNYPAPYKFTFFIDNLSPSTGVPIIGLGENHSIAIKSDGTVWAWGGNENGQLGNGLHGPGNNSFKPNQVKLLEDIKTIFSGDNHTLALKNDGTVWTWGYNIYGQIGNGTYDVADTPVQISDLEDVTAITAGNNYSVVLKNNGTVWAWGHNNHGQLGNGYNTNSYVPVQVVFPLGI